ncbi:MAG TPA: Asp23/Gls24 family envelope stress response protein [Ktedonobacteraceae bacterium]|nr:Asp23/Gls24 family envelope stress response protein [Ktedonobacteraceae bacterium]
MAVESQPRGVVRVARQVLSTIVTNTASQIPGVVRMAHTNDQWSRLLGRDVPKGGVALSIRENIVSADLYLVVEAGVNIVEVGTAVQEEVASAIAEMVGMQVKEVNVYIQDVT